MVMNINASSSTSGVTNVSNVSCILEKEHRNILMLLCFDKGNSAIHSTKKRILPSIHHLLLIRV